MAEEVRPIIKVEVGDSEKSVKGLKKEISDLRDKILNLTKGTDEYNEAVEQLQQNQRDLDNVMALTKKNATALEGSYDALTHQMSQLKKEWRATADEARRADLGKQIDEINNQLKELDASTGNFQRNVGNYVSHWEGMPEVTKDFGTAMREMNESIEPTKAKFESVGNIASGLASGFAAVQGAAALLGVENEDLQQTFVKLQAAMALAQGLGGLSGLVEGVGKAKVAFAGFGQEVKAVTKTMGKTGWLAVIMLVVTAITLLYQHIKKKNEQINDSITAMREYNKVAAEARVGMSDEILKIKLLTDISTDISVAMDTRRKAAIKLLEIMGLEVTEANILKATNGDLEKSINGVTEAMIRQKIAEAQMERVMELYKEWQRLAQEERDFSLDEIFNYDIGTHLWATYNEFTNAINSLVGASQGPSSFEIYNADWIQQVEDARIAYTKAMEHMKNNTDADTIVNYLLGDTSKDNGTDDAKKALQERINGYIETLKSARQKLDEWYNKEIAEANKYGLDTTAITQKYKADLKKINDLEKAATGKEVDAEKLKAQELLKTTNDYFKSKAQLLTEKYQEDLALLEKYGLDTTNLTKKYQQDLANLNKKDAVDYSGEADKKIRDLERVAKREVEINSISALSDEEKAAEKYRIEKKLAEDKLALLEEYYAKAKGDGNKDEMLQLEQEIADQTVAIKRAQYDEEERLRQENIKKEEDAAQKRVDITNKVAESLSAAGSVTQGILEITQAAAEKDGEITEQEAKKIKGLQIAIATMNMLAGITAALSGAFTTKSGPWDIALAAIQATTIAAAGTANIMKIKNTDLTGSVSGGAQAAVTPNSNIYGTDIPFSYTKQVTGASEIDTLNQDQRVYILESDIQESNKRVSVRENESSF